MKKNILINGIFFIGSTLLIISLLLISEFASRALTPGYKKRISELDMTFSEVYGWKIPIYFKHGRNGWKSLNSKGYLGKEYAYKRDPSKKRILMLGDSITFGFYMKPEKTFSAILDSSNEDIEVINFGVNGYSTDQELIRFQREGLLFRPDIVMLNFCLVNDFFENAVLISNRRYLKPYYTFEEGQLKLWNSHLKFSLLKRVSYELIQRSILFQDILLLFNKDFKIYKDDAKFLNKDTWIAAQEIAYDKKEATVEELTYKLIKEIANVATSHDIQFILAIFPDKRCFEKGCPILDRLIGSPELKGLRMINLLDYLTKYNLSLETYDQFSFDPQFHLTPNGHKIVAEIFLRYLQDEKLLPLD